jgi:adenylate cyclase
LQNAILLAILVGACGSILVLLPWGVEFEERVGLGWLFRNRGSIPASPEVAIVGVDKRSSVAFGVDYDTKAWDRRRYAELID